MATIMDLKKYLSTEENPLSMAEFNEFWKTLTDVEKEEYKKTVDELMAVS